jgi:hypothetical protein
VWIDCSGHQFGAAQNHELQSSMILAEEAIRLVEGILVDIEEVEICPDTIISGSAWCALVQGVCA